MAPPVVACKGLLPCAVAARKARLAHHEPRAPPKALQLTPSQSNRSACGQSMLRRAFTRTARARVAARCCRCRRWCC